MAKGNGNKSSGTSRIRFIMVDAELSDGDIGPITLAIQNALRGPGTTTMPRIASISPAKAGAQDADELPAESDEVFEEVVGDVSTTSKISNKRPGIKRVAPSPQVIDMDEAGTSSLKSFIGRINPKSQHKRYLAIAAWYNDERQTNTVTADHIYTCYRILSWPTTVKDFGQPLRELKHQKYFTLPEKGKYAINHLGLAKAREANTNGE